MFYWLLLDLSGSLSFQLLLWLSLSYQLLWLLLVILGFPFLQLLSFSFYLYHFKNCKFFQQFRLLVNSCLKFLIFLFQAIKNGQYAIVHTFLFAHELTNFHILAYKCLYSLNVIFYFPVGDYIYLWMFDKIFMKFLVWLFGSLIKILVLILLLK